MIMIPILKKELDSPTIFERKFGKYLQDIKKQISKAGIDFEDEELNSLILSACRANDLNVIKCEGSKRFLDESQLLTWVNKKLLPNTVVLSLDDEDIIRLLIFCIEITYQMFAGGTRATVTQKGFRERRRTFETILVDQFSGKLGEVMLKRFLERSFQTTVELDWGISTQIEKYKNDIINATKKVSIKSSPALAGIWAEADIGYDYGICVKCSIPQPTILQFFIEACGFSRLLDFAENRIPSQDTRFKEYLKEIRERIKSYKCGEIQTKLKGFICGYFKTSHYKPIKKGEVLPYLGEVREERYLAPINELEYTLNGWAIFLKDVGLLV
jgi:hypothetical protein